MTIAQSHLKCHNFCVAEVYETIVYSGFVPSLFILNHNVIVQLTLLPHKECAIEKNVCK